MVEKFTVKSALQTRNNLQ